MLYITGITCVCDSGWQEYSGSCYISKNNKGTRNSALNYCQGFGASLICINDAAENTFVLNNV